MGMIDRCDHLRYAVVCVWDCQDPEVIATDLTAEAAAARCELGNMSPEAGNLEIIVPMHHLPLWQDEGEMKVYLTYSEPAVARRQREKKLQFKSLERSRQAPPTNGHVEVY